MRIHRPEVSLLLACCVVFASGAQQLGTSSAPSGPLAQPRDSGIGPVLKVEPTPRVRGDLAERPQSGPTISAFGPAQVLPLDLDAAGVEAVRQPAARLLDPDGRPIPGVIRVAPNRVYDPGSGRYYWTAGTGAAEHVQP